MAWLTFLIFFNTFIYKNKNCFSSLLGFISSLSQLAWDKRLCCCCCCWIYKNKNYKSITLMKIFFIEIIQYRSTVKRTRRFWINKSRSPTAEWRKRKIIHFSKQRCLLVLSHINTMLLHVQNEDEEWRVDIGKASTVHALNRLTSNTLDCQDTRPTWLKPHKG
jgi:hypothetical protein